MGRCSSCKNEAYPRYKYKKSGVAGVYCQTCYSHITGRGIRIRRGFWGWVRDRFDDIRRLFRPTLPKPNMKQQPKLTYAKSRQARIPTPFSLRNPHHLR